MCGLQRVRAVFFPKEKIVLTGNPVRQDIIDISNDNKVDDRLSLLVIGGSLGARTINESMLQNLDKLTQQNINVKWQTGKLYYDEINNVLKNRPVNVEIMPFIEDMKSAYANADIIVSRAGALSISELCLVGKPVILVPSPNVSEDHQTKNAMALVDVNAASLIKDIEAKDKLVDCIIDLSKDVEQRKKLSANVSALAKPNATTDIVKEAISLLNK